MKIILVIVAIAIVGCSIFLVISVKYNRSVNKIWRSLKSQPTNAVFTPDMVADLDEPVRRYFLHAIAPGTPIAACVELEMSGSFCLKPDADWLPMNASQIISTTPPGFVWKASIGKASMSFSGADYYSQSKGRMRFFLWGLLPLVNAQNKNIDRSAVGRMGAEYIWLPSALLPQHNVAWQAIADNIIQANFKIDNEPINLTLTIASDGSLLKLSLPRWGDKTEDSNWQYITFGGETREEKTFDGYTIPAKISAGWWFGTDKYWEFFQSSIERAKFS
ncbi:DUF6544 family protein [Myxosarcina sp. GI1]|uniref:DUF6920 family protein n=1 Tax=Myxosarcina sp. GI1 TaxID=1541065 RepID=UPI00056BECB7|nr:DUF6544 family protein [Myxosarcina sp. GI1]